MNIVDVIKQLDEQPKFGEDLLANPLQEATWNFVREQLSCRLEVRVEKSYGTFGIHDPKIKVTLVLDDVPISSDEVYVE